MHAARWTRKPIRPIRPISIAIAGAMMCLLASCSASHKPSADAPTHAAADFSTGPITVAVSDPTGAIAASVATWNTQNPNDQVTLKPLPADASSRRDLLVENLQQHTAGFDVVLTDLSSTAEFASHQWIQPLTGRYAVDSSSLVAPAVASGTYAGALYAEPITAETGLLYYRRDVLSTPPATWPALTADCATATASALACFSGQYAQGSDLSTNALEAISANGGHILAPDGKTMDADNSGTRAAFTLFADAYAKQVIPAAAITYSTAQSVRAFSSGSLLMLRADADAYAALSTKGSAVAGKFGIAVLPRAAASTVAFRGLGASVNATAKHAQTALAFVKFLDSTPTQTTLLAKGSLPPALASLYLDAGMRSRYPFLAPLQETWNSAQPILVSPAYQAVSDAVGDAAYSVLSGVKKPSQAAADLQQTLSALPPN